MRSPMAFHNAWRSSVISYTLSKTRKGFGKVGHNGLDNGHTDSRAGVCYISYLHDDY